MKISGSCIAGPPMHLKILVAFSIISSTYASLCFTGLPILRHGLRGNKVLSIGRRLACQQARVVRCAIVAEDNEASKKVCDRTRQWVEEVIVGYNICPFAMKPVSENTVRYCMSDATNADDLVKDSWREAARLLDTDPSELATTLLMAPNFAGDIDEYAGMGYWMEDYLEDEDEPIFEGALTTAVFHPDWTFEGMAGEDPIHFEKRSPYPTVSLLRRDEMGAKVTDHFERTGGSLSQKIADENAKSLQKAGWDKLKKMLAI